MPKYRVAVQEIKEHVVTVEADNKDQALDIATEEAYRQHPDAEYLEAVHQEEID